MAVSKEDFIWLGKILHKSFKQKIALHERERPKKKNKVPAVVSFLPKEYLYFFPADHCSIADIYFVKWNKFGIDYFSVSMEFIPSQGRLCSFSVWGRLTMVFLWDLTRPRFTCWESLNPSLHGGKRKYKVIIFMSYKRTTNESIFKMKVMKKNTQTC